MASSIQTEFFEFLWILWVFQCLVQLNFAQIFFCTTRDDYKFNLLETSHRRDFSLLDILTANGCNGGSGCSGGSTAVTVNLVGLVVAFFASVAFTRAQWINEFVLSLRDSCINCNKYINTLKNTVINFVCSVAIHFSMHFNMYYFRHMHNYMVPNSFIFIKNVFQSCPESLNVQVISILKFLSCIIDILNYASMEDSAMKPYPFEGHACTWWDLH